MEKLLVLLVLIAGCYSQGQDLSGKVLVFPKRSTTDYVTLKPEKTDGGLKAMTVCLRFISGDKNEQTLFSMATSGHHNTPLLYKHADRTERRPSIGGRRRLLTAEQETALVNMVLPIIPSV
ncbi:hypothetical protein JZ751_027155 [Albula glossodonta]|uniref:Pentraxin (PTX) domain-containing protein n=1 Tax=Albula glossodonta TaxID=121402 RepID=A0A8T2NNW5_9TELE|nr:hypothetical protein JZ751_027155 [Albula glossodonta]